MAETPIGSMRVHCGTWRWQCDVADTGDRCDVAGTGDRHWATPAGLTAPDPASDQDRAA
ncbi:MAG TPA: hypothetical protein VGJ13_04570 [Pseudonocardiaceae bacterium]